MIGERLALYEILEKIGAGGMGEVYRARDTKLEREAKAVAALRHPHIVTIHSVEEADGVPFLTMELLQGRTLAECIPVSGYDLERFFVLAIAIADAVGLALAQHRPPRSQAGQRRARARPPREGARFRAKLMASGSAGPMATVLGTVTGEGRVLGTAACMAPEQAEGKPTDARSDVFSLGDPANRDVWIRQHCLFDLVRVYVWLGDTEAAIDRLEELTAVSREQVSGPLLRTSPVFDPLRQNPRFQRLLAQSLDEVGGEAGIRTLGAQ